MSNGVGTPNITPSSVLDEFLGNQTLGGVKRVVRVPLGALFNGLTATSIYVTAATKAELDGLLNYAPKVGAQVISDPVEANNGVYQKLGEPGSGSWKRIGNLSADAAAISATQAGNSKDAAAAFAASAAASAATLPTGGAGYTTQAALNADLNWPADTIKQVIADPAASTATAGNGTYRKVGSPGFGSWVKVTDASVVGLDARTKRLGSRLSLTGDRLVERDSLSLIRRLRSDGRVLAFHCDPDGVPYVRADSGLDAARINRGLDAYGLPYAEAYRPEWMREAHHRLGILGSYGGLRATVNCQFAMLFQGDSWSTNSFYFIGPLARFLAARYGDAGPGYVGFGFSSSGTINGNARFEVVGISKTGSWTSTYGTAPMPDHSMATSGANGDTYAIAYTKPALGADVTAIDLFAIAGTTNVQYRFGQTGGWTVLDLSGSGFKLATIPTVPVGSWYLEIQALGAGAQLGGINMRSDAKGVLIHKAGSSGTRSSQWSSADATIYQAALAALAPHSVSILSGTNSQRVIGGVSGYDGDTERGYLATLVTRIKAALPSADVVLVTPPENASTGNAFPMTVYAAAHRRLAYDTGIVHLDLQPAFGEAVALYQDGSPRSWLDSTLIHPSSNNGGFVIADRYAQLLGVEGGGVLSTDITDATTTGRAVLTAATAATGATALGLGTGNSPTWTSGTFTAGATVSGGVLDFGGRVANLVTFFPGYTMGIQSSTVFIRSPNDFCIYGGGTYSTTQADPGTGGTRLIRANVNMVEVGARLGLPSFTVATLPAGSNGSAIYVSNARKVGEATGAGTGVVAYYSNNNWRRPSDDTAVAA